MEGGRQVGLERGEGRERRGLGRESHVPGAPVPPEPPGLTLPGTGGEGPGVAGAAFVVFMPVGGFLLLFSLK